MMPHNNQTLQSGADIRPSIINEELGEPSMGMLLDEVDAAYDIDSAECRRAKVAQLIETFLIAHHATA